MSLPRNRGQDNEATRMNVSTIDGLGIPCVYS